MPKKIEPDEEYEEEEEEEEEDLEEPVQPVRGRGKLVKKQLPPLPKKQPEPQRRYTAFAQQAAEGIMDNETQEVIATDIWTALANIIERLERIENSIGIMQEG